MQGEIYILQKTHFFVFFMGNVVTQSLLTYTQIKLASIKVVDQY